MSLAGARVDRVMFWVPQAGSVGLGVSIFSYAGKLPPVVTWEDAVAQCRMMSELAAPGLTHAQWLEVARQRFREEGDGTVVVD